jgi:hypothetical protein
MTSLAEAKPRLGGELPVWTLEEMTTMPARSRIRASRRGPASPRLAASTIAASASVGAPTPTNGAAPSLPRSSSRSGSRKTIARIADVSRVTRPRPRSRESPPAPRRSVPGRAARKRCNEPRTEFLGLQQTLDPLQRSGPSEGRYERWRRSAARSTSRRFSSLSRSSARSRTSCERALSSGVLFGNLFFTVLAFEVVEQAMDARLDVEQQADDNGRVAPLRLPLHAGSLRDGRAAAIGSARHGGRATRAGPAPRLHESAGSRGRASRSCGRRSPA